MIVILAKAPRPGYCKTRLVPRLGQQGAAQLQAALLRRTVATARQTGDEVVVFAAPSCKHPAFLRLRRLGVRTRLQHGTNLGARMLNAVRTGLKTSSRVLVLGTDCPQLQAELLDQALSGQQPTLIPATDGGYVALALSHPSPRVFQGVRWGSPRVLGQTRTNLRRLNSAWRELRVHSDLDTPQDWQRQRASGTLASHTHRRRC